MIPHTTTPTHYQPHIDGLRAIAVMGVVLYHAKLLWATGGFVGVDVFFVLSGYLITSIIIREQSAGTFTLVGFWERRVRRILPALVVVMSATIVSAYVWMLYTPDYQRLGTAILGQSFFVSNIVFLFADNYFSDASRFSPILHTWSLSVEEQFYLFFPLLVLVCVWIGRTKLLKIKWGRILLVCSGALCILSFILAYWWIQVAPNDGFTLSLIPRHVLWGITNATAGFYLLPSRLWELGLGIILTLSTFKIRSLILAEILSTVGMGAILFSIFIFTDATPFPGLWALVPTLGTVVFIFSNTNYTTQVGRILSRPYFLWIGLISYPLYLWHWPVFVFARLLSPIALSKSMMLALILASVMLAWLTYQFIETPFRKKIFFPQRNTLFLFGFFAITLLAISGFIMERYSSVYSRRIPSTAQNILRATTTNIPWSGRCFKTHDDTVRYGEMCRIGNRDIVSNPQFIVWGDSHADALVPLFDSLARDYKLQGVVFDSTSCLPLPNVHQIPEAVGCNDENKNALRYIEEHDIRHVILVARWSYYITGGYYGKHEAFVTDSNTPATSSIEATLIFERNFVSLVQQFVREGREVIIVKQVPEQFNFNPRDAFYSAVHTGENFQLQGISKVMNDAFQASSNSVIDTLATQPGVHSIDPATLLCTQGGLCTLLNNDQLLYRDEDHLSTAGALRLEPLFVQFFQNMHFLLGNNEK